MQSDVPDLPSRVEELERRLTQLEARLAAVEGRPGEVPSTERQELEPAKLPAPRPLAGVTLPLIGRTLLVLAGAFLLRAITETGVVPQGAGIALGIGYAILWIVLSDRAAAGDARTSAMFHGIAAAIIAYPLVWEATVRFGFLSPLAGAGALAAITMLALFVAWHRKLRRLAWVFTVGSAVTALALVGATKMLVLFACLMLLLGLVTLWLGYAHGWLGPAWLAAALLDGLVLLMVVTVLQGRREQILEILSPASLVTFQLAMVVAYLGSFALRTLSKGRKLLVGEMVQGAAVLLVALGGAMAVTRAAELPGLELGVVSLALATGCYAVSFVFIDRLPVRTNFVAYTTLALLFTVVALEELLDGPPRAMAFSFVALVTAWLGARWERATLGLHGAVYTLAAIVVAGLGRGALDALVEPGVAGPEWITLPIVVALVVTGVCCWFPAVTHGRTWGRMLSRAPRVMLLALLVLGIDGIAVSLFAPLLPVAAEAAAYAGALAALRTGVLALSAVGLAVAGHGPRRAEASLLVYPMLIVGGVKLLLEDVRAGRPSTLFVSLALYGGALILAPRLARRGAGPREGH
jgi:hypothetical protein